MKQDTIRICGKQAAPHGDACWLLVSMAGVCCCCAVSPIDPLQTNVGQAALGSMSAEQIEKLEAYWGVGRAGGRAVFLLGRGCASRRSGNVAPLQAAGGGGHRGKAHEFPAAFSLRHGSFPACIGLFLGILAGHKRGGAADKLVTGYALIAASTPGFWIAMVLLMVFSVWLGLVPHRLKRPHRRGGGRNYVRR